MAVQHSCKGASGDFILGEESLACRRLEKVANGSVDTRFTEIVDRR
jgi:hypothetical protein